MAIEFMAAGLCTGLLAAKGTSCTVRAGCSACGAVERTWKLTGRTVSTERDKPCCTAFNSFCREIGFSRKLSAPMRVASTAVSMVA